MESAIYSDGSGLHISNLRITAKNKVLAVRNLSSVESNKAVAKSPVSAYLMAGFGFLFFFGAILSGSGVGAMVFLTVTLIGALLAYLRQPKFEVVAVTNAGERVCLYLGAQAEAQRIAAAVGHAITDEPGTGSRVRTNDPVAA